MLFAVGGPLLSATAFALVLVAECYVTVEVLGRVIDRTDLRDVMVAG